jgi:hypothetical protein
MNPGVYIHEIATACALGADGDAVLRNLLSPEPPVVSGRMNLPDGRPVPVGQLPFEIGDSGTDSRCNLLADHLLKSLGPAIAQRMDSVGPRRTAVVIGTSTSGVREAGAAYALFLQELSGRRRRSSATRPRMWRDALARRGPFTESRRRARPEQRLSRVRQDCSRRGFAMWLLPAVLTRYVT